MKPGTLLTLAGFAVVFGAILYSQGCGGNDPVPVVFQGNVASVELPATAARPAETSDRFLASLGSSRFELVSSAVAQSAACTAETQQNLRDVFLCVVTARADNAEPTATPTEAPETTPTPEPTPALRSQCFRVSANTCEFQAHVRLTADHDPVLLIFSNSTDGSGNGDAAFLTGYETTEFCNGDVVRIPDVDVDFPGGTATAGGPIVKEIDACPVTVPTATATQGGGGETPTPTVTGTPPTPEPTTSETPSEATPTETPASCFASGAPCGASFECCSNVCVLGVFCQ